MTQLTARLNSGKAISPPLLALGLAVLLYIIGGIINPNFLNITQAVNIVRLAAFLGIIAAGQTLVIISGGEGIDLSVGAVVTLAAIFTLRYSQGENELIVIGLAAALLAGAIVGLVNGVGIVFLRIPPLVMTLAMAGIVQGGILAVSQGTLSGTVAPAMTRFISDPLIFGLIPGVVIIWAVVAGGLWLLMERTPYGKRLFAVGVNRTTARLSGIRVPVVVMITYMLSGLLAAFGGFVLLGFTQTVYLNLGVPFLFPSIAAVVVGGTTLAGGEGSYWGTMAGALVLTLIESLLRAMGLQEAFQLIILGSILVLLLSIYGRDRNIRQ